MNVTSGLSPTRCSQLTEGPAFRERLTWEPWGRSQGPSSLVQAACVPSHALGSRKVGFKWQMCQEGDTSTPDCYLLWQQLGLLCVPDKAQRQRRWLSGLAGLNSTCQAVGTLRIQLRWVKPDYRFTQNIHATGKNESESTGSQMLLPSCPAFPFRLFSRLRERNKYTLGATIWVRVL